MTYSNLLPNNWENIIDDYLKYDIPKFDIGGFVVENNIKEAHLLMKSQGKLSGIPFFNAVFKKLKCSITWYKKEGYVCSLEEANKKLVVAKVVGPARNILQGERVALNILARSSGIATYATFLNKIKEDNNWKGEIAGTRKTTPGFSLIEKYSILVGGCSTHRMDLSSMVMLKDNHIWSVGSITKAIEKARTAAGFSTKIEVECQEKEHAIEAAKAGADIVMLDNFKPNQLKKVAAEIKQDFPNLIIEASGGITEETIVNYFSNYVDVISMGKLSQGYSTLDFSLKIQKY